MATDGPPSHPSPSVHQFGHLVVFEVPQNDRTVSLRIRFWTEADWDATAEASRPTEHKKIPGGYVAWMTVTRDPHAEHVLPPADEWPRDADQ